MCFLLHKWNTTMNYSDGAMEEAKAKMNLFSKFFSNVKVLLRGEAKGAERWNPIEVELHDALMRCMQTVRVVVSLSSSSRKACVMTSTQKVQ